MSQATLTLRPPPNVDFVQGYPGIPPGADRPQAAVKGAIEVRAGQQGVKAKWVRIELRKVEVLPGGGQAGTFFDYVGQSPINLWTGPDGEYGVLRPQDFPFYIRIPESLPPTIALEKGAGIKYELIAMVCIKGKKGFFRRDKSTIVSTASQIIIDKHELHSTWPIYSQPETRNIIQDGVTLIVQRGQTCYGPGDRVAVNATIKADNLNTILLRGFEFTLRESTVFRSGPGVGNKRGAPQVRVVTIAEQKVPVNATLYGGTQHKAELSCTVPPYHTSATINAARHIDITYLLSVKALMGTGLPIAMDLPVVVSNWPKTVSLEAARRIGPVPNLSLVAGQPVQPQLAQPVITSTAHNRRPSEDRQDKAAQFNTAPTQPSNGYIANGGFKADELGYGVGSGTSKTVSGGTLPTSTSPSRYVDPRSGSSGSGSGRPGSTGGRRPGSSGTRPGSGGGRNRLLVANMGDEIPEESPVNPAPSSPPKPPSPPLFSPQQQQQRWLSAEEEKKRLYESAVARVEQVQGIQSIPPPEPSPPLQQPVGHVDAGPILVGPNAKPPPWSTAEEEKQRLYDQAQAAVIRTQGMAYSSPQEATSQHVSVGAALYSDAMLSIRREPQNTETQSSPERSNATPQYPAPQTEKDMIKRYYDAKAAASRNQGQDYVQAEPISYDALYPSNHPNSGTTSQPSNYQQPPSFTSGRDDPPAFSAGSHHPVLSEKERLRRHYEAQDAASNAVASPTSIPTPVYMPTPQPSQVMSPYPQQYPITPPQTNSPPPPLHSPPPPMNAVSEKEMLRRKYEAEDASRQAQSQTTRVPATPTRSGSALPPIPRSPSVQASSPGRSLTAAEEKAQLAARYADYPPTSPPSTGRPLTAAEEKAQLRAQYEARDQASSPVQPQHIQPPTSAFSNVNPNNTLPTPPPLKPRPPVDYINRTREEDNRTQSQYFDLQGVGSTGSLREQANPGFSRQFSLREPTTNGTENGDAYGHGS